MRLSTRIAVLCAAAVLPSLAIQAWHEVASRQARIEEVRAEARRFALQSASELSRMLEGARNLLAAVGEAHLRGGTYPGCGAGLAALSIRMPRYVSIGVSDAEGRILCSSSGAAGPASIASRPYFVRARERQEFQVGAVMEVTRGGEMRRILPLALPIMSGGRFVGVAITSIDTIWLSENLVSSGALPPGGSVTVADREGVIVARTPQPQAFIGTPIPAPFSDLVQAASPGVIDVVSQDGTPRILGYVPVGAGTTGLYVSAGFPTGPALQRVNDATQRALLLVLAGLLSALAAAWLFGRIYLRKPVDQLLDSMRRWTAGDHAARSHSDDRGEIGRLAAGFNAMADAVAMREQELREGEARLRDVLGQMPVAVVLAEIPSGREVFRNARAQALLQCAGLRDGDGCPGEAALPEPLAGPLREAIRCGTMTEGLELPLRRADGSETVLAVSAAPVRAAGGVKLAVAAFLDVGARRHAERQRELLTAELRHRVKNALAVVQSMVAQTLAQSASLEEFRHSFNPRLSMLAKAQDALFASEDGLVRLDALVRATLAPFGAAVLVRGPDVPLPAKQTLSLAMVLHEMATNAAKHGALRPGAGGGVAVSWTLEPAPHDPHEDAAERQSAPEPAEGQWVHLRWVECADLPATPTSRRGFGARLIDRCVTHDLRGHAESILDPAGITWQLVFPHPRETGTLPMELAIPA
ncbi:HAMP domain-containing protein [Roseomonas frigidaquae]|uniref:histidine kinase n=1 Tax=Falsiroseomonas frigidaquae TaxID=487318 RepID=A0ABX1F190_9PROT|nr:cache domain-containing protein [Falsiroseomonas frigidaquae]NKE46081.1 HAMP domain-containing protein [Falsiroseomonas frigidaquae]